MTYVNVNAIRGRHLFRPFSGPDRGRGRPGSLATAAAQLPQLALQPLELVLQVERGRRFDRHVFHVAGAEPLPGKVLDKSLGSPILEHPLDLRGKILAEFAALRQPEQLLVRHRRPQETREPGSQRVFVDERLQRIVRAGGCVFRAEYESRRGEHGDHRPAREVAQ